MKKILILLVFTTFSICGFASRAMYLPFQIVLNDGTQRTVSLCGDEHFSFYVSSKGEMVIKSGNLWRLATKEDEEIANKALRQSRNRVNEQIYATRPFSHIGTPKALVIFAEFSDNSFSFPADQLKKMFVGNQKNSPSELASYSSLAEYFNYCSKGQYRPQFDFVGPVKLPQTIAYYGKNSSNTNDINYKVFIEDACKAAHNIGVDFSQYDEDNDGYVDLVYIMYAGYGENSGGDSNTIWSKSGTGNFGSYDGKIINRYGVNNELFGNPDIEKNNFNGNKILNGIGVLAHEFCHTLGLPDMYPTIKWQDVASYDNQSMEYWDLMDNGENNRNGFAPTPLTAWEREVFGWIEIPTLSSPTDITLKTLDNDGIAYRIINDNDASNNEYYILENIPNKDNGWYHYMRGKGMLVTHINYNSSDFSNFGKPNNIQGKPKITILPADGQMLSGYRLNNDTPTDKQITNTQYNNDHAGDTYPGTTNTTSITDYKAYTGTVEKPITDIVELIDGSISFKFMGGSTTGIEEVEVGESGSNASLSSRGSKGSNGEYNLAGQKVNNNYKGLIIKNGRKYIK